jgi:hypothetical protein
LLSAGIGRGFLFGSMKSNGAFRFWGPFHHFAQGLNDSFDLMVVQLDRLRQVVELIDEFTGRDHEAAK